jgi:predicted transcriptional regulator
MSTKPKTANLKIRVEPALRAALEQVAETDRRPLAQLIRVALEDFAAARREQQGEPAGATSAFGLTA